MFQHILCIIELYTYFFMAKKIKIFNISVEEKFLNFVNKEVLSGLEINNEDFWKGFSDLINQFNPLNKQLLIKRNFFQVDKDGLGKTS